MIRILTNWVIDEEDAGRYAGIIACKARLMC